MISLPLVALALIPYALAAPQPEAYADPIHIPLSRRSRTNRVANLPQIADALRIKYGYRPVNTLAKRATAAAVPITDEDNDSSYSGVVSIGTPAQNLNVFLDTGSADLWVATSQCTSCASDVPPFDTTSSSSFKTSSSDIEIDYGSGSVKGTISQDTVSLGGFTVPQQTLLAVTDTTSGLLYDGLSGIMGLGFEVLSAQNATPFWVALDNGGQLSSPVMSFYLERYVNQAEQIATAAGGVLTLGGTNTSLYSGNIEFINMPSGTTPSYWLQEVTALTVQGSSVSIPSGGGLAAIDTGTTLIGAPSTVAASIWNAVPGSVALTGQYQGMYAFPCTTDVAVTISYGGTAWPISSEDMNLGSISLSTSTSSSATQMCVGGIFDVGSSVGTGSGAPAWIVGDTFLKNVYSVFRADPPSVGFATLASGAATSSGSSGSNPAQVSGGGSPLPTGSGGGGLLPGAASPNMNLASSLTLLVTFAVSIAFML
ncbi:aspartic peptidase domain-containing protein [Hygrophoropsis aurantiaca]|uniref:Aspartic peptidase domain-containing protein n=1 Tax=Hygrophoropsis aurantiaca TaxID=72124 RepID=A0ACB8A1I1_9AGAM|nr:aspartic peptidase domain-containing protein [Hygrophoropsis aurantiaca]